MPNGFAELGDCMNVLEEIEAVRREGQAAAVERKRILADVNVLDTELVDALLVNDAERGIKAMQKLEAATAELNLMSFVERVRIARMACLIEKSRKQEK